MTLDWDTFYHEHWAQTHEIGDEPDLEDYYGWLFDKADLMIGYRNEV